MNLRRVLPRRVRWHFALRWVEAAEAAEAMAKLERWEGTEDQYGKLAIEHYLRALAWHPLDHPGQLTDPGTAGGQAQTGPVIPCVWCGEPIPQARKGETGSGLYCPACG